MARARLLPRASAEPNSLPSRRWTSTSARSSPARPTCTRYGSAIAIGRTNSASTTPPLLPLLRWACPTPPRTPGLLDRLGPGELNRLPPTREWQNEQRNDWACWSKDRQAYFLYDGQDMSANSRPSEADDIALLRRTFDVARRAQTRGN